MKRTKEDRKKNKGGNARQRRTRRRKLGIVIEYVKKTPAMTATTSFTYVGCWL